MIVCVCRGVSDREVRTAIESGATCLDTLQARGIGGDCCGCQETLRQMVTECAGDGACRSCRLSQPETECA
ncbi:MAG TPA: (2Fe-2S)-binding protein [Thermoanaerobaculia bacterium]|nr:(2Fe-2S)-binding protein [Thermoanaerobaculia bacterium]